VHRYGKYVVLAITGAIVRWRLNAKKRAAAT
jgi:hypothetical protein